jgi:hypothetical protein
VVNHHRLLEPIGYITPADSGGFPALDFDTHWRHHVTYAAHASDMGEAQSPGGQDGSGMQRFDRCSQGSPG